MTYPLTAYHFNVEWGGTRIGFSEVSGLDIDVQPIHYREGNSPVYAPVVMPGLSRYSNIVLKRGMMRGDIELFSWFHTIRLNEVERRDVVISLLDEQHEPVTVWTVRNAWPVRLQGPVFNASRNEIAIEQLELAHEGLRIDTA